MFVPVAAMNLTIAEKPHPRLPQSEASEIPQLEASHTDKPDAEEELRIMELELAILKKKREFVNRSNAVQGTNSVSHVSTPDGGTTDDVIPCKYYTVRNGKYYEGADRQVGQAPAPSAAR